MPEPAVIAGVVATVIIAPLLLDLLKNGGEAWWFRQLAALVHRARRRYEGWREKKRRKGIEAGLDKVRELVSRRGDFDAAESSFVWPEELRRHWFDASAQLIESEVDWVVEFPEYGATARRERNGMKVDWGDFDINADPWLQSVGTGRRNLSP